MSTSGSPKKKKRAVRAAVHPPVSVMVTDAIRNLKDRKGSSLVAIKKYVAANNRGIDMNRMAYFIRNCLKRGVASGAFKQASGTGAAGRFRLGAKPKVAKKKKAKKAKKPKKKRKPKKAKKAKKPKKAKKAKKPKKAKAKKPKKAAKKKPAAKKAKRPAKKAARKSPKKAAKKSSKKAAKK